MGKIPLLPPIAIFSVSVKKEYSMVINVSYSFVFQLLECKTLNLNILWNVFIYFLFGYINSWDFSHLLFSPILTSCVAVFEKRFQNYVNKGWKFLILQVKVGDLLKALRSGFEQFLWLKYFMFLICARKKILRRWSVKLKKTILKH